MDTHINPTVSMPKKRGRKPKNQLPNTPINNPNTMSDNKPTELYQTIDENTIKSILNNDVLSNIEVKIPKKRGRKPKNQNMDQSLEQHSISNEENNKTDTITRKKRVSKKDSDTLQKTNYNVDIQLKKDLDLTEDNSIVEPIKEEQNIVSNIWLNKYQPKTLSQIIGNRDQILQFKKWLSNYDNSQNHATVISGGHGVGKNLITRLALQETGYEVRNIYGTSLKSKNIVNEIIHSCAKTKNVYSSITQSSNQFNKKYAIVVDDTESITLTSEKDNLIELFKYNAQHKCFPLIFISNLQHSKLINNLKKMSLEITLYAPSSDLIKDYIVNICKKENMTITDEKIYLQIIRFCQSDIRRLLYVLQDLFYTYGKKPITVDMFKEYQVMSQKKGVDVGLYYAAKNLLDEYKNINECLQLYETEKVLLPLTVYENYYHKIFKQKLSNHKLLNIMADVTNSVSIGDVIETNIYSDQNWFLHTIHGFYTCADISYIVNTIGKEKSDSPTNTKKVINYECTFSADLNKTSSKNINKKKNILVLQSKFENKNIDDILYINKIIYELDKNKMTNATKLIKDTYNLDNKNIQIALKIDKTNEKNIKVKKTAEDDEPEAYTESLDV